MNVLPVSRNRQRLEKWYQIVLPAPDVVELLINKTKFYAYALQEGLRIPQTYMLKSRSEAEQAAQELVFPCITKPAYRSKEWDLNNEKAYKSENASNFLALYDRCAKWSTELVIQEWVEGSDSTLYTVDSYFGDDFEPLVTFVSRKLRHWPPEMGEGCLGEECRNDIVLEEAIRLFKKVGLNGFGYLEMKHNSRTGEYLIIEPNVGRPTIRSATAEAGGVELLYTMYCDALGWDLPENRQQKYGNVKWVFLRRDLQSAFYYWRRGELTLMEWWQSLRGRKVYALFSWTDLGPFIGDFLRAIRLFFVSN
jgi:predicted ATP-grasp superfamily ATP-dependent carboligase